MQVNKFNKGYQGFSPVFDTPFKTPVEQHGNQNNCIAAPAPKTDSSAITCFTPGTAITTLRGKMPVELLRSGDKVLTRDRGFQPILWVGSRQLCPVELSPHSGSRPVLVRAGALGPGLPERDMVISPRHRILTTDKSLLESLGETEALIEAHLLVGQPGIMQGSTTAVTYIHLLFDHHEIILSDNMWSESFHLGHSAVKALLSKQHAEILAHFPDIHENGRSPVQPLARVCISDTDEPGRLTA